MICTLRPSALLAPYLISFHGRFMAWVWCASTVLLCVTLRELSRCSLLSHEHDSTNDMTM